jgi:hypothetical protein
MSVSKPCVDQGTPGSSGVYVRIKRFSKVLGVEYDAVVLLLGKWIFAISRVLVIVSGLCIGADGKIRDWWS